MLLYGELPQQGPEQSMLAERKTERSGPKRRVSGAVSGGRKTSGAERSAEREVAVRKRSVQGAESAAHGRLSPLS